mgnify:CR=1 FL=1
MSALALGTNHGATPWFKWLSYAVFAALLLLAFVDPVFAQVGGGTGTSTAVQTRVTNVVTGFQAIMYAVGAFILAAAFMYVGYGMAFGGKKCSDVANVFYGAVIAGAGVLLVTWLFL